MSGTLIHLAFAGIRSRLLSSLLTVLLAMALSMPLSDIGGSLFLGLGLLDLVPAEDRTTGQRHGCRGQHC